MKTASSDLIVFLLRKQPYWSADLFTISTLATGTIRLTSADQAITDLSGNVFSAGGPQITRSRWAVKNTLDIPEMSITIGSTGTDSTLGNIKALAAQGLFDGATISLDRAFMPQFGDVSLGTVRLFGGRASALQVSPAEVKIAVKGHNSLMQQYMPRNVFSASCIHALYDAGCGLSRSDYTTAYTVGSGSASKVITWATPPAHPEYYSYGVVSITSGAGTGQTRTVLSATAAGLLLAYPLYTVPAPGDSFTAYYGCTRTRGVSGEAAPNCTTPFNNVAHFRGFPYIPPAETAFKFRPRSIERDGRRCRFPQTSLAQ